MRLALSLPPLVLLLAQLTPPPVRSVEWQVSPSLGGAVTWQEQGSAANHQANWQILTPQVTPVPQSIPVDATPSLETTPIIEPKPAVVDQPLKASRILVFRGVARDVTVNGRVFPTAVFQVPNGFAQDQRLWGSVTAVGISRTRPCSKDTIDCADAQSYVDLTPLRVGPASLGMQWGVVSLSSRNNGTQAFSGQHLGFRAAVNLSPQTGLALGGEQVVQFDDQVDLGRNFYAVLSQAVPLGTGEASSPFLLATAGIGSDLYGYKGNGWLGRSGCGGSRAITSTNYPRGSDCTWGPIGSIAFFLNDRISLGGEWFGYGFSAGVAIKPFRDWPMTLSVFATDFLGNTPAYIQDDCPDRSCSTRIYGRLTQSF